MEYDFLTLSELAAELGRRAREYRLRKRLEQAEVAELAGVSSRTVRFLELGRGSSVDTLLRVMKALGTLDGLNSLFPQAATVDPLAILKRTAQVRRVYRKRGPRE